jgi:hypothetical protein
MMRRSSMRDLLLVGVIATGGCNGSVGESAGPGGRPPGPPADPGLPPTPGTPAIPGANVPEIPGATPLRRLTRAQYNNTVRDLLGLSGEFGATFAGDDDAGGFRSNVVSPVSEPQVEQYYRTAEDLATRAVAGGLAKLAPCPPPRPEPACADEFVRNFGKRAFRRPLTPEEVDRYQQVYQAGRGASGDLASGVTLVIAAMLQSPNFLYLPEIGDSAAKEKDGVPLDGYEVASRLSYFLLGSMPDEELFAAADARALRTPEQIGAQARRLLKSPRARDAIVSFFTQWLEVTELGSIDKDAMLFPEFTPALRTAMRDEIGAFADHVLRTGDGRLQTLLTSSLSFPSAPLLPIYGLPARQGMGQVADVPVELPRAQRSGLLTLAGVMSVYAHPDQTGPVGRGFMVSEKLLCITPPPAPDNVNTMLPKPDANVTTRERLEQHRVDPACSSCHALMDPYGLTFENYDAIGRYRTTDGRKAVDATATGLPEIGDVKDALELMAKLAASPVVRSCLTKQWFRYAFGRSEVASDEGTLATALAAFAGADHAMPDLLVGLATSRGFRFRTAVTP